MPFRTSTIEQFTQDLISKQPTPGGGSAAAIAGAIAASLTGMVASTTMGKTGYEQAEAHMRRVRESAEQLRTRLLRLADEDATAYQAVLASFRLPQETEVEQRDRAEAIEFALQGAVLTPIQIMQACVEVLDIGKISIEHGNHNAIGDAAAGVQLAAAALESAALNVRVNLQSIADENFCSTQRQKATILRQQGLQIKELALALVDQRSGNP